MARHGVYVSEQSTSVSVPVVAESGIPFVIGAAPIQAAENPAKIKRPILCISFDDAKAKLGYSDDWVKYNLCEFMDSHFNRFQKQPVIFVNLLDPANATMVQSVAAADIDVVNHRAALPFEAINDDTLVVKKGGGAGDALVKDTDYAVIYQGDKCYIEVLPDGAGYTQTKLNIAYTKVKPDAVTGTVVATGMESIDLCMGTLGIVPDLVCSPGYSMEAATAAAITAKASSINGMFKAKALIDISTKAAGGATTYDAVAGVKAANNFVDENQIICWPKLKLGDKVYHLSTQLAGRIASTDTDNDGCPYESPSNKALKCDSVILDNGDEVVLTNSQANALHEIGVVTAFSFMGEFVAWGNYTACYPMDTDVKNFMIPIARMFAWVGNTLIKTFWKKVSKPAKRRLVDSIIDATNIWLNGLIGAEYVLGARVELRESDNPLTDLMMGIIRPRIFITPPPPLQELEFLLEYDIKYVESALM